MTTGSVPGRANDRELGIADSTDSERNSITTSDLGLALSQVRAAECLLHCALDFPESSAGTDRLLIIRDMLETALRALGQEQITDDDVDSVTIAATDAYFAQFEGREPPPVHWSIVKNVARIGVLAGMALERGSRS